MVRGSDGAFELVERYDEKREIGTYRTVDTLERAVEQFGERGAPQIGGKISRSREGTALIKKIRDCGEDCEILAGKNRIADR